MKKILTSIAAVLVLTMLLVGCGAQSGSETKTGGEQPSAKESAPEKAAAPTNDTGSEKVTIWYYWETPGHQAALNKVVTDFKANQTAIEVEAKYVPFADFKKQLSIGASVDELPDLVILDNPDHASYAAMGIFADITGKYNVDTYYEGPVNSCTLDGKLYGVPFGSNCLLLYYNEDMLAAAGKKVPTTWDELLDVAKSCTKGNVSGFAHSGLQNEEGTFNYLTWLWSTGATSYEMNSAGGVKALGMVKSLIDSGAMTKESINWTQGDTMNQFISGNLATMITGTWQVPTMRSEDPDLKWNVAPIPMDAKQASGLGGENYAVIAGGNEDAAVEYLKYATSKDVCLYMMNAMGYISSDSTIAKDQFSGDPVYQAFVDEMQYAYA